jgi:hypothetical protein
VGYFYNFQVTAQGNPLGAQLPNQVNLFYNRTHINVSQDFAANVASSNSSRADGHGPILLS